MKIEMNYGQTNKSPTATAKVLRQIADQIEKSPKLHSLRITLTLAGKLSTCVVADGVSSPLLDGLASEPAPATREVVEPPRMFEGVLHCNQSCVVDDWYVIEDSYGGRINDADIEGHAREMRALARAIRRRKRYVTDRCAVRFADGRALLCSPRNSTAPTSVTLEAADALARQIRQLLGKLAMNKTTASPSGGGT